MPQNIKIIDCDRNVLATAAVEDMGSHYSGTIELSQMPKALREMFEEYETVINDQMLSLLDDIEGRIEQTPMFVVFSDGSQASTTDIQIFPTTGSVSFKATFERSVASK